MYRIAYVNFASARSICKGYIVKWSHRLTEVQGLTDMRVAKANAL